MKIFNFIYSETSDIKFKTMIFSDGQPHIKLNMKSIESLDKSEEIKLFTRIANATEAAHLREPLK
jgi:ribose-phosphate pyrophosphokinase